MIINYLIIEWIFYHHSAIELKYALQTGNRLKFNLYGIIDNILSFYSKMKDDPELKQVYDICKDFSNGGHEWKYYRIICAILYLIEDQKRMIYEYNNKSSNVQVSNFSNPEIKTVDDLLEVMKKSN